MEYDYGRGQLVPDDCNLDVFLAVLTDPSDLPPILPFMQLARYQRVTEEQIGGGVFSDAESSSDIGGEQEEDFFQLDEAEENEQHEQEGLAAETDHALLPNDESDDTEELVELEYQLLANYVAEEIQNGKQQANLRVLCDIDVLTAAQHNISSGHPPDFSNIICSPIYKRSHYRSFLVHYLKQLSVLDGVPIEQVLHHHFMTYHETERKTCGT